MSYNFVYSKYMGYLFAGSFGKILNVCFIRRVITCGKTAKRILDVYTYSKFLGHFIRNTCIPGHSCKFLEYWKFLRDRFPQLYSYL